MDELKKRLDDLESQVLKLTKIVQKPERSVDGDEYCHSSHEPQPEMESSMELLEKMQRRKKELLTNSTVNLELEKKRDDLKRLLCK
jgi:hypothetical protein